MRRLIGPRLQALALAVVGAATGGGSIHAQAELTIGNGAARPGETADVSITLASAVDATALQLDVLFDPTKLAAGTPAIGGGLGDHELSSVEPEAGLLRIVIHSPTNSVLPVGVVATVPFTVEPAAPVGQTPLDPAAAEVATPAATAILPLGLFAGGVHVFTLEASLHLDLSADRSLVADGDPLAYTLVVSNSGPDDATGVHVTDSLPADLTGVTWSCSASGGATCTASGSGDLDDLADLPAGGTVTYTIEATVDTMAAFIDNTAEVEGPPEVFDADLSDNSATVTVDVCLIDDLELVGWDIDDFEVFNACVTLTAGPDFNIGSTGEVILRSLGSVILRDGVSVETGGKLGIEIE